MQKAKVDLENCTITSPIDGIVISRNVDVGQTVAASLNAPVIFQVAADLTNMQINANVAEANIGAVAMDQDVEFTERGVPNESRVIRLQDVQKTYRTGEVEVHAVRGVTLDIARGEFVALMCASGSGKSTLLNILGCLERPSAGVYMLDGENVSSLSRDPLTDVRNQKLGFVFQNFNLLARTSALENVELPLLYRTRRFTNAELRERAERVLAAVGLGARGDHHPSQLSGGQQRRVAVARALINDPEVLLADEPTGNLDSRTSVEVMEIFQRLNAEGMTIVMVTHEPDIASYAKRNVVMRDGRIVSDRAVERRLDAKVELTKLQDELVSVVG